MGQSIYVNELHDPLRHMGLARETIHPHLQPRPVDDTAYFALEMLRELGPDIVRWRSELLVEIEQLFHDFKDEISNWHASLRPHVQSAYMQPKSLAGFVAVPVMARLAEVIG